MKRDVVAPVRKAKIPIPAASYRVFWDFCRNTSNFGTALSQKKRIFIHNLNSSRGASSGEFKLKYKSYLKNRILVQDQGGFKIQPRGILKYFDGL